MCHPCDGKVVLNAAPLTSSRFYYFSEEICNARMTLIRAFTSLDFTRATDLKMDKTGAYAAALSRYILTFAFRILGANRDRLFDAKRRMNLIDVNST